MKTFSILEFFVWTGCRRLLFLFLIFSSGAYAKVIKYDLKVTRQTVNMTGSPVGFALTVNGGIPAPILEFTEGDDAEITVHNDIPDEEVSIHWHGILLPPLEDGVAYVNTPPIFPGSSRTFKFKIRQHGTYWYHSHTAVQEQKGVYGAFIVHPKKDLKNYDEDLVVVLSDWSDENPDQIIRNLRKDGDYYLYKKKSVRSVFGAIEAGHFKTYLTNEWNRMGGMDLSDVGYDAFLMNGLKNSQLTEAHPGQKIRLRIINAAASSYFYVSLGQLPFQVIAADGVDVEKILAKEILIGMAETYDVLFEVPSHKNYELRATAQDNTGYASGWIGAGEKVFAAAKPELNLYAPMAHENHHSHSDPLPHVGSHSHSDSSSNEHPSHHDQTHADQAQSHLNHEQKLHNEHGLNASSGPVESLTVDNLQAVASTEFPSSAPRYDLKLILDGDMERYVWHINGKAIHQDRDILIRAGDVIRFTFVNQTMMHHPMHLHGHFFRVLNANDSKSPLKHTVDVPPHGSRTIEFYANEPGQWMLHCHNLYHMKTGMARVVKYMSYSPTPEMAYWEKHDPHLHDHVYPYGYVQAATNHIEAGLRLSQTWNEFEGRVEARHDEEWDPEADLFYRRWYGNYMNAIAGGSLIHHDTRGELGLGLILPGLIEMQLLVDHFGQLRVDIEKRIQWTSKFYSDIEYTWRQDSRLGSDYILSLMYARQWNWSAGVKYTGESFGAGFQYRF